ncbi:MAG: acetyl-CoA carboxylase biotin carboxyl carrier protein subunit [Proteobacteria bacterium]|nr:MAG: acetyl-CoA carboxylase biotin carboxyl carrier protein subunit [Pseudomonadota bacterium]
MATLEVKSEVIGTVWKVEMTPGDDVTAGDVIMILESMKMEIPVEAPEDGRLAAIVVAPDDSVDEEQVLCTIET